jgi:hypothetical protein
MPEVAVPESDDGRGWSRADVDKLGTHKPH